MASRSRVRSHERIHLFGAEVQLQPEEPEARNDYRRDYGRASGERARVRSLNVMICRSFSRALNPGPGTNWEGVRVEPHLKVSAAKALFVARAEAPRTHWSRRRRMARKRGRCSGCWTDWPWNAIRLSARLCTGKLCWHAWPCWIRFRNGALTPEEGRRIQDDPFGNWFIAETLDYFRLQFRRDGSGAWWNSGTVRQRGYGPHRARGRVRDCRLDFFSWFSY
jgi:hypothetical protein